MAFAPPRYAELDVTTNFSFLRGASHPDEMVFTSALLGHRAMAVTDVNTVASFVLGNHLAGVHFWSYDRDVDCPPGSASPTCNSIGGAGAHGFLKRFQSAGL